MNRKGPTNARRRGPQRRQPAVAPVYDGPPSMVTGKREVLLCLALAFLTVVAYCRVFSNDFVNLDDDYLVSNNVWVQMGLQWPAVKWAFTTRDFGNWHPLTWLSHQLDDQLFGINPAAYHAVNLLIHLGATLTLYRLLRIMTGAVARSACAAAFFGVHPLHVESVAWISERKDVLSTLFFLLALLSWPRYAKRASKPAYLKTLALFVASLMSKAMGVSLPLVLMLLDMWPFARMRASDGGRRQHESHWERLVPLLVEKLPFVVFSAIISVVAVVAQYQAHAMEYGQSLSLIERWRLVPVNYVTYLAKTFWPLNLAALYPHPGADLPLWKPIGATLFLALATAACYSLRKSRPYLIVGWAWFVVTLLPVIGIVQLGRQAIADRYMYMPMIGLLIMVCWGGADLAAGVRRFRPALAAVCALALGSCTWLTFQQVAIWRDSFTLWDHALRITPPTHMSCNNYAQALEQRGRIDDAEYWYRKSIELDPDYFYPNFNLGIILSKKGRQDEAAEHFEIALRSQPNNPVLLESLGVVEELRGNYDAAIDYYQRSAQLNRRSPKIYQHLRRVFEKRARG